MSAEDSSHLAARLALLEELLVTVINGSKREIQVTARDLLTRRQMENRPPRTMPAAGHQAPSVPSFVHLSAREDIERKNLMHDYIATLLERLDYPAPPVN